MAYSQILVVSRQWQIRPSFSLPSCYLYGKVSLRMTVPKRVSHLLRGGKKKKKRTNRKLSYHWHYHGASSRLNWRRRLPSDVLQYDVPRKRKAISRNGAGSRSGSRFVARDKKSTAAELTRAKIMPVFSLSRLISSLTRYGHQA